MSIPTRVKVADFCEGIADITERRYRQLAKEGWVPDTVKGEIDFKGAVKGLLNYYRDRVCQKEEERHKDLHK